MHHKSYHASKTKIIDGEISQSAMMDVDRNYIVRDEPNVTGMLQTVSDLPNHPMQLKILDY